MSKVDTRPTLTAMGQMLVITENQAVEAHAPNKGYIRSQRVEAILLFGILEELRKLNERLARQAPVRGTRKHPR